jgi:hypothetical protein
MGGFGEEGSATDRNHRFIDLKSLNLSSSGVLESLIPDDEMLF